MASFILNVTDNNHHNIELPLCSQYSPALASTWGQGDPHLYVNLRCALRQRSGSLDLINSGSALLPLSLPRWGVIDLDGIRIPIELRNAAR